MKKMVNKAVAKSKPSVSPNPMVTGGMARPKAGGLLGGAPKPTVAQQKMVAKKVNPAARAQPLGRSVSKAGVGGLAAAMAPKVQPKPVIRSTAKPAMPARKK